MAKHDTLLSFVIHHRATGLEDMATAGLHFILSRSKSARSALSEFLGDDGDPLPVAKAETWSTGTHGAVPDMSCRDENDSLVAFIEAKFWASLTHNQPVTYWNELPDDRPAVLMFLAPGCRVKGSLWGELVDLLLKAGHELEPDDRSASWITASAKVGQRRLMLTSWELLLKKLIERAAEEDVQACFEIAELQGLVESAIAGDNPRGDENLKRLIRDAVKRVEQLGWANTDGLREGDTSDYHARYIHLAGVSAGVRIDYELKRRLDKPLWLWLYGASDDKVSMKKVSSVLKGKDEPGLEWQRGDVCVPIDLPAGADKDATLEAIVAKLECVARLIDPEGPTYRKDDQPTADQSRDAASEVGERDES